VTIECAGNGRSFYSPPVAGVQWQKGAVGTARWTGVRLRDVLARVRAKASARFVLFDGADAPLATIPDFVRQVPIAKALDPDTILAYEMNGAPLPIANGFPLRAIVPGWEGAYSVKWLTHVQVLDREGDSFWIKTAYRYPTRRIAPEAAVAPEDMAPVAGLFVISAAYVWFKQAFGLASHEDFVLRGLAERTLVTQALFLAGWLLGSGSLRLPRVAPDGARLAGTLLTAVAAARLLWFDILLFNPALQDQWAGSLPLFNLIAANYLPGAVWLYLARRRAATAAHSWPWLAAFLVALIAATALLVRQYYHGAFLTGAALPNEAYGYSLAFLIVSIGLIVAGIRLPDKALRLAGLVLLTATIVKVFLVDAAELTGVLRILSFLVLGIALIGIGRLYGPILRAEREEPGGAGLADGAASR